jgi:hypothetical protein
MTLDPNDVVKVASGEQVVIDLYRNRLSEEGIEARTLGDRLEASFGTAIPGSIELWVHRGTADRAAAVIRELEEQRGKTSGHDRPTFPHPTDDSHKPRQGGHGPHTHYSADPRS